MTSGFAATVALLAINFSIAPFASGFGKNQTNILPYIEAKRAKQKKASNHTRAEYYAILRESLDYRERYQALVYLAESFSQEAPHLCLQYVAMADALPKDLEQNPDPRLTLASGRAYFEMGNMNIALRKAKELQTLSVDLNDRGQDQMKKRALEFLVEVSANAKVWDVFNESSTLYRKTYRYHEQNERTLKYIAKAYKAQDLDSKFFKLVEKMASFHPSTNGAEWAYSTLYSLSQNRDNLGKRKYYFQLKLLRKINRYSFLQNGLREEILSLLDGPIKTKSGAIKLLTPQERVYALNTVREKEEAIKQAHIEIENPETSQFTSLNLHRFLAKLYLDTKQLKKSEKHLEIYLSGSQDKQNISAKRSLARLFRKRGKLDKAASTYHQLVKKSGVHKDKWDHFWTVYLSKNYKKAIQLFKTPGYIRHPDFRKNPSGKSYWLAKLEARNNNPKRSEFIKQTITAKWPDSYYAFLIENQKGNPRAEIIPGLSNQSLIANVSPNWEAFIADKANLESQQKRYPLAFEPILEPVTKTVDIDPFLVLSIMRAESHYNPLVLSVTGARGLMQMMPATAERISRLLDDQDFAIHDLHQPEISIAYGAYYLKMLLDYYDGNHFAAIAAYNAGPSRVNRWLKTCNGCSPDEFAEMIPIKETRRYVKKVFSFYSRYSYIYNHEQPVRKISRKMPKSTKSEAGIF